MIDGDKSEVIVNDDKAIEDFIDRINNLYSIEYIASTDKNKTTQTIRMFVNPIYYYDTECEILYSSVTNEEYFYQYKVVSMSKLKRITLKIFIKRSFKNYSLYYIVVLIVLILYTIYQISKV